MDEKKIEKHLNDLTEARHLLIIDDEIPVLESLKIALSQKYKVFTAQNYDEAKPIFENNRIDVAILDIRLPKMTGDDILIKIKENDPCTEVIMHTIVKDDIGTVVKCIKLGAYNYLTKPCDLDTIVSMVDAAYSKSILYRSYKLLDNKLGKEWKDKKDQNFTDYLKGLTNYLISL